MFFNPENLIRMLPAGEREVIAELLDQEGAVLEDSSYQIFSCPDCQRQESRLIYQIRLPDGEVYRPEFFCSHCGATLEKVDQIRPHEVCPECGSHSLLIGMGEWD